MSTLKVDTYLTRGGASEIAIDKLKGVTAAGSMLVVGEGGTTTTNLQQGLAKAWINFNGTGTIAVRDSFNFSGITDNATGNYTVTINNDMANANHVVTTGMTSYDGQADTRYVAMLRSAGSNDWSNYTTTSFQTISNEIANGGSNIDQSLLIYSVDGDLA